MMNPIRFLREVRQETRKVTPPTRGEVITTTIMVFILVALAAVFFFAADWVFAQLVQLLIPGR